jgi:hypothetical protein
MNLHAPLVQLHHDFLYCRKSHSFITSEWQQKYWYVIQIAVADFFFKKLYSLCFFFKKKTAAAIEVAELYVLRLLQRELWMCFFNSIFKKKN